MIIKVFITERDGELGWEGDRLATSEEYDKALAYAKQANPKYPRDYFLPLDKGEVIELQEGLFKVGASLERLAVP